MSAPFSRSSPILRFAGYTLDLRQCALRRGEEAVELRPKSFDVLRYLAENPGRVIGKEELIGAVWRGSAVTDDALVQCIKDARHALADESRSIIRTVPRRGYLFAAEPADGSPRGTPPAHSARNLAYCRASDGVKLAFEASGRGMPLVRTPTWFNHLEFDWSVQFRGALYRFLAERVQLVRYDGRGSGLSERHVPDISFAGFEDDLQAVIAALGVQRYGLLGISQGAPVAIAHAVRHPGRVSKLVLNGAFAQGSNRRASDIDHETAQAHLTLMRHGWGNEHSAFLRTFAMLYFPGASAEELKTLAQLQRVAMSAEVAVRLRMAAADIDIVDLLPQVSVPTLILHSRYDNAVPLEEGQRLAAAIPHAKFVVLESENHVPMPEEPAWPHFIAEIEAFLSA